MADTARDDLLRQADGYVRQGRLDAAIGAFEQLVQLPPTDWNLVKQLADLQERAGHREAAATRFLECAGHYFEEGFLARAAALYRKVLKLDQKSEHALGKLADVSLELKLKMDARQALSQLAAVRRERGDGAGAREAEARLLALDGDESRANLRAAPAPERAPVEPLTRDPEPSPEREPHPAPEPQSEVDVQVDRLSDRELDLEAVEPAPEAAAEPEPAPPAEPYAWEWPEPETEPEPSSAPEPEPDDAPYHDPESGPEPWTVGVEVEPDLPVFVPDEKPVGVHVDVPPDVLPVAVALPPLAGRGGPAGPAAFDWGALLGRVVEPSADEVTQATQPTVTVDPASGAVDPAVPTVDQAAPVVAVQAVAEIANEIAPEEEEIDLTELLDQLAADRKAPLPAPSMQRTTEPSASPDPAAGAHAAWPVVANAPHGSFEASALADASEEGQNDGDARAVAARQLAAGRVFAAAGLVAEAARAFERASREARTRFEAAEALGALHRSRGQLSEAVRWYDEASQAPVADEAVRRPVLYDLAEALEAVGQPGRALAVLLELLSDVEDYRDARARADRLLRVDAGG